MEFMLLSSFETLFNIESKELVVLWNRRKQSLSARETKSRKISLLLLFNCGYNFQLMFNNMTANVDALAMKEPSVLRLPAATAD